MSGIAEVWPYFFNPFFAIKWDHFSVWTKQNKKVNMLNLLDIDFHWESPRGRLRALGKKWSLLHHCPPPDLGVHLYFSAKVKLSRRLSRVPTPTNEGEPGVGTTTESSPFTHPHVVSWLRKHNAAHIPQSSLRLLGLGLIHPFNKYRLSTVCVSGLRLEQVRKGLPWKEGFRVDAAPATLL